MQIETLVEITLPFCEVSICSNYIYVVMKEGITVSLSHHKYLADIADTYFDNRNFIYITDRKNSYSVDPSIYIKTANIINLMGIVVIQSRNCAMSNPQIEALFYSKPIVVAQGIEEALLLKDILISK